MNNRITLLGHFQEYVKSLEWDNAGHSSKDSSIAPAPEKLTQIQTLVNVNWTDLFLGRM